jgi:hypothetical protein
VTEKTARSLIGVAGVTTSLLAGHWVPFLEFWSAARVEVSSGVQAGGSGLCAGPPTGLSCDASWARGSGSFCPCGSPG